MLSVTPKHLFVEHWNLLINSTDIKHTYILRENKPTSRHKHVVLQGQAEAIQRDSRYIFYQLQPMHVAYYILAYHMGHIVMKVRCNRYPNRIIFNGNCPPNARTSGNDEQQETLF